MKELIMQNELAMCAETLKKRFSRTRGFREVYFAGDCNFICDYLLKTMTALNAKLQKYDSITYLTTGSENDYRKKTLEDVESVMDISELAPVDSKKMILTKRLVFFFVNCIDGLKDRDTTVAALEKIFDYMRGYPNTKLVVTVLLPKTPALKNDVTSFSEREYNFYIENFCDTDEFRYYIEIEKICRNHCKQDEAVVSLLRFDNVFAPDICHTPAFDIKSIIKECAKTKTVTITDDDVKSVASFTYVRTACHAVLYAATRARRGNVYNVAKEVASVETVKNRIYTLKSDVYSLKTELSAREVPEYRVLNSLKFTKTGFKVKSLFTTGIKHLISYVAGEDYDTSGSVSFYAGKIKQIQQLEVKILLEIDRICKKHDIQYFLAGGSLLGAVRSGMSIEWDDDLDIGMLREDFEKFRKIAPRELGPEFSYSSPFNDSGSHYTIDKIRLDDTYFSTNFSNHSRFPDGIFVDILVYDKTSNTKLGQKFHGFVLTALTHLMLIKWWGAPRAKFHYRFSKRFMPVIKLLPWGVYNGLFDFFAKLYRHKKNARFLIDTVGKKVHDGPLPNEGLDEVVYVDFEGIKAPVPVDPVPYLEYAYGPSYMEKPPLDKRRCPHNFARIDLGKYVYDIEGSTPFRKVNVLGELYEDELDEMTEEE